MKVMLLSFLIGSVLLCYTLSCSHAAQLLVDTTTVACQDGTSCPNGNTCCAKVDGGYGCCPLSDAVCCEDKIHCCPQGSQCDVSGGECITAVDDKIQQQKWINKFLTFVRSGDVVSSQQKTDSIPAVESELSVLSEVGAEASRVVCPDRTSVCNDGSTCCLMPNHQWVCCPLPYAACCPDGYHCCPHGYRCDVHSYRCTLGDTRVAFVSIVAPVNLKNSNKRL